MSGQHGGQKMRGSTHEMGSKATITRSGRAEAPARWVESQRVSPTGTGLVLDHDLIRISNLRKTLEAMRSPVVSVGPSGNRTAAVEVLHGAPMRYYAMLFVSVAHVSG